MTITKKQALIALLVVFAFAVMSQVSMLTTYAALPAPNVGGRVLFTSDSWLVAQDTGVALNYFGPLFKLTPPPAISTWTKVNEGTTSWTETYGGINAVPQNVGAANSQRLLVRAEPATPYTITAAIRFMGRYGAAAGTRTSCGLGWRESGTSKLSLLEIFDGSTTVTGSLVLQDWANATSAPAASPFAQNANSFNGPGPFWLRIQNTGAALVAYYSADGANWVQVHTGALNRYLTTAPDQVAFSTTAWEASVLCSCTLLSWEVQ